MNDLQPFVFGTIVRLKTKSEQQRDSLRLQQQDNLMSSRVSSIGMMNTAVIFFYGIYYHSIIHNFLRGKPVTLLMPSLTFLLLVHACVRFSFCTFSYNKPLLPRKTSTNTTKINDIPPANFNVGPSMASPVIRSIGSSLGDRVRNPR